MNEERKTRNFRPRRMTGTIYERASLGSAALRNCASHLTLLRGAGKPLYSGVAYERGENPGTFRDGKLQVLLRQGVIKMPESGKIRYIVPHLCQKSPKVSLFAARFRVGIESFPNGMDANAYSTSGVNLSLWTGSILRAATLQARGSDPSRPPIRSGSSLASDPLGGVP